MKQTQVVEAAFNEAYASLNAAQKEAVDTIDGPVMVIAGPGTGKTQVLTLRIANILLQTDTNADSILALTFTESGAKAMRERLRLYIGSDAYRVNIHTFHGFAQQLINKYPDSYMRVIGGRPAGDLEKIKIIETILEDNSIKLLRPMGNPSYYVTHIQRILSKLKQEYVTPDKFNEIIVGQEKELLEIEKVHTKGAHKGKVRGEYSTKEKNINKNYELLSVYRKYEALLSDQNLFDFDDTLVETVEALSNQEEMLRDLQENYQYVLADEHQDVNGAQNKILELLVSFHDRPNIFAVGDEKQAIFRFQGASLDNFLAFTDLWSDTKVISMTENYRSGQNILDVSHSLVEVESGPLKDLRVPLKAKEVKDSVVSQRQFCHQAIEDDWLVEEVKKEIDTGVKPEEVAIILRTNREVEEFTARLRKAGVSATASADGDVLRKPITQAIRSLAEVVSNPSSEEALFSVLHGAYWGIDTNDLIKVLSKQSYKENVWQIISNDKRLSELQLSKPEAVKNIVTVIEEARKREVSEAPHRVLEFVLEQSGFLKYVMTVDPLEGSRVVRRLYDEVEELFLRNDVESLRDVSQVFKQRLEYGLPLNAPYITTDTESVQVMTAHKSKGLEFASVFIPHVTDSGWSGAGKRKYFDIPLAKYSEEDKDQSIEDERRLLYVALTRAKNKLFLSMSETNADGKELLPSRLLEDIEPSLIVEESTVESEKEFSTLNSLQGGVSEVALDTNLIKQIFLERGFSATSLNNYLRSPFDYLYRNVLRVPQTQPVHMQYGTAIHGVLEMATKQRKAGALPSNSDIKKALEKELNKLPITETEYVRLLEKGLEAMVIYREHLAKTLPKDTKEELKLKVHLQTGVPEFPEILLTGMLDRMDFDDSGKAVRVVDYKTGKAKSRNQIEGKTKDGDGAYKRQLVFYALLLSLHDDENLNCREGVLSFVQPDSKGAIKEESFIITDEEVEELKQIIIESAKAIVSGEAFKEPCDPKTSEYCDLAQTFLPAK